MFATILYGLVARVVSPFIPIQSKHWVFGADAGNSYRENSKYLIEYMLKNHSDYNCVFVTQNRTICEDLNRRGIPAVLNNSFKAIIIIARAEAIFVTQSTADVRFAFKKKGRKHFYMLHGMSQKRSWNQLPNGFVRDLQLGHSLFSKMRRTISWYLTVGYSMSDVPMFCCCSDYLVKYLKKDFGNDSNVEVIGMPRNDALFDDNRMANEKWLEGVEGKFIILYMPTHRLYGAGEVTPTPFITNLEVQNWMRRNNVLFVMKNHPNMIKKTINVFENDVIKDITKMGLDPQVCIYHANVLITDYSSVWMDYLLLKRPILFYYYDHFDLEDVGVYFNINKELPNNICYSEGDLYKKLRCIVSNYDLLKPSDEFLHLFHKYVDGNSTERYYNKVKELFKKDSVI